MRGSVSLSMHRPTLGMSIGGRARYFLTTNAARFPPIALPLARLRRQGELLDGHTDILIESFPRCASSFAVAAFRLAQEPRAVHVAHQTHAPGHVISAVRRHIPALVLIREPTELVVSNLVRHPERGVRGILRGFLRFYEPLLRHRSGIVVGTFDEVVSGRFGPVIGRVNERFGTEFAEFEATGENVERCLGQIERDWPQRRGQDHGETDLFVRTPSTFRDDMKGDLRHWYLARAPMRLRRRAENLYEELTR